MILLIIDNNLFLQRRLNLNVLYILFIYIKTLQEQNVFRKIYKAKLNKLHIMRYK